MSWRGFLHINPAWEMSKHAQDLCPKLSVHKCTYSFFKYFRRNLTSSRTIIFWLLSSWTVPLKLLTFHFSLDIHITLLLGFWADTSHACTHPHKNSAITSMRKLHELKIVSHIWEHCLRYYVIFFFKTSTKFCMEVVKWVLL